MDANTGDIFAGSCVYACGERHDYDFNYHLLPQKLNNTNFPVCSSLHVHRTGMLYGVCQRNQRSPVLSYNLRLS